MLEIILWSLLAFFSAFGIVEFVRFAYSDWTSSEEYYHVVICADKFNDDVEMAVRNAILATDCGSLIVVTDYGLEENPEIYEKLSRKYAHIKLMNTEEYIKHIKSREC